MTSPARSPDRQHLVPLGALCAPHAVTVVAEGSQNNEIGLPLTLCRLEEDTEIAIVEMGMRGLGQIADLCEIARPDVGIVTSVGPVHLELLGTVERVAQAKAELIESLPPGVYELRVTVTDNHDQQTRSAFFTVTGG